MTTLAQITALIAYYLLNVIQLAMLARAVLSWIMPDAEGGILNLIYGLTEPFVGFVRKILYRLNFGAEGPIDFAFLFTVILLSIAQFFLRTLL